MRNAAPVMQNHLSKPEDLMFQNATPLRISARWPPNISDEHVSCTAPATRNASLQILFKSHMHASVIETATKPQFLLTFGRVQNPLRLPHKTASWLQKGLWEWCALYILTSKCARHLNFQSALNMVCFVHFDFDMCFALKRCVHFFDISTSKSALNVTCF